MADAYVAMVLNDRTASAHADAGVRERATTPTCARRCAAGYGKLHLFVETVSGLPQEDVSHWFAVGKLLNVIAAMDLLELSRALGAPARRGRGRPSACFASRGAVGYRVFFAV